MQIAVRVSKVMLKELTKDAPPNHNVYGKKSCCYCNSKLVCDGWKSHYICDPNSKFQRIWTLIMICPHCHATFHFVPYFIIGKHVYTERVIRHCIVYYFKFRKLDPNLKVPKSTQFSWIKRDSYRFIRLDNAQTTNPPLENENQVSPADTETNDKSGINPNE